MVLVFSISGFFVYKKYFSESVKIKTNETKIKEVYSKYTMSGGLENFDLIFLQLENQNNNTIYSPLSIKYALGMLREGVASENKRQIDSVSESIKVKSISMF